MGIKLLFEDVEALEAVLADSKKLSVKGLEGIERAGFGHGQIAVNDRRIATALGLQSQDNGGNGSRWGSWSGACDVVLSCLSLPFPVDFFLAAHALSRCGTRLRYYGHQGGWCRCISWPMNAGGRAARRPAEVRAIASQGCAPSSKVDRSRQVKLILQQAGTA